MLRQRIVNKILKKYQPKKDGLIHNFIIKIIFRNCDVVPWYKDIFSNPKLEMISLQYEESSVNVKSFVNNNKSDRKYD